MDQFQAGSSASSTPFAGAPDAIGPQPTEVSPGQAGGGGLGQYGAIPPGQGGFGGIGNAPAAPRPGEGSQPPGQLPDNVRQMFEGVQGQNQQLALALQQAQEKIAQFEPYQQQLDGLRKVFTPDEGPVELDPIPGYQQQLDYYLQQAIDAEKAGAPIPLTTNLAVSHFQSQIKNHQLQQEQRGIIEKLQEQVQFANDPNRLMDNQAYANIDTNIMKGLTQFYGNDPTMDRIKGAQFKAVGGLIADEIKNLQSSNPRAWEQVRRDPGAQSRMVDHFLMQYQPPQVKQMLERQKIQNEPMGNDELMQAFREAGQIEDPNTRTDVQARIRQTILEQGYRGGSGRPEPMARAAAAAGGGGVGSMMRR